MELYITIRNVKCYCPDCEKQWTTFIEVHSEKVKDLRCPRCDTNDININFVSKPYELNI